MAAAGRGRRRRVLPRAHRRGQGDDRAVRAAADRRLADDRVRPARAERLFRTLTDQIVELDAGGGRAGEAVHEHVALHQVRGRQPVLHDRQRLRPRLRAHPRRAHATTTRAPPTCPAPGSPPARACSRTRCSWPRSTTTTSCSATRRCSINEGLPLYVVVPARAALRPRDHDRRHPRHGVQGRVRRHPRRASRTSSKRILRVQGGRVLCTDPYVTIDADLLPLDDGRSHASDLLVIGTPHREYRDLERRRSGRRHLEPAAATGCRCDEPPRGLGRHPGLQRGRRDRAACLDRHPRRRARCRARSSSSSTTPTTPTVGRRRRSRRAPTRGSVPTLNTYGRGPANAIRYGIDHARRRRGRGDDGRRQRRPAADRRARASSSSGASSSLPPRATCPAASRSAARSQEPAVAARRAARCYLFGPGRDARRHELVQGVLDATSSRDGRHRVRHRVRDRHRAGREGTAAAPARSPRSRRSGSSGRRACPTSRWWRGSRATCAGTASRSAGAVRPTQLRPARNASPTTQDEPERCKVLVTGSAGFIGGYVVAGAARRAATRSSASTTSPSTGRSASLRRRSRATRSSRATRATSS